MTIEYKDSKRIVALSSDVADTATFEEFFDSTGHTSDGTTVNGWYATDISALKYDGDNDNMYFNNAMDNTDDIMYYDLQNSNALGSGNFANATKWVVRMKINITTSSGTGANGNQFSIGLSSAVGITDTYDFMGIHIVQNHNSAGDIVCNATVNNGYPQNQGTSGNRLGATSIDMASSSDWWLEIKRDGDDCTCILYEDEFTGTSYTKTNTVTNISNLRYIFFRPQKDSAGATFTGSIDNIVVYDGVSSTTNKPTNVQDNSILVEKDTARRYWFNGTTWTMQPTYDTDFTSTSGWLTDGTDINIDTSVNAIISDNNNGSTTHQGISKDLGSDLHATKWVIDLDIYCTNITNSNSNWTHIGMSNYNASRDDDEAQNFMGINVLAEYTQLTTGNGNYLGLMSNSNTTLGNFTPVGVSGDGNEVATGTQFYLRLIRDGETTLKLERHSTSARTGSTLTTTHSCNNLSGLRYFVISHRSRTHSGRQNLKIENVRFYNGVTSIN